MTPLHLAAWGGKTEVSKGLLGEGASLSAVDHLKSLIFDCISFTEGLITCLFTANSEAPASIRIFVTSVFPSCAAL
jgi:hypothetical protein